MVALDALRLAGLAIAIGGLAALAWAALRARGERPLAPIRLALGVIGLVVSVALIVILSAIELHPPVLVALLAGGALVGFAAALAVRVRRTDAGVVLRGGAWHVLPAGVALLMLQTAGIAGSLDLFVVGTAAAVACAAFAASAATLLVLRGAITRPSPGPSVPPTLPADRQEYAVAAAGSLAPGRTRPGGAPVRIACGACGAPVRTGWRHCVTCGSPLAWA